MEVDRVGVVDPLNRSHSGSTPPTKVTVAGRADVGPEIEVGQRDCCITGVLLGCRDMVHLLPHGSGRDTEVVLDPGEALTRPDHGPAAFTTTSASRSPSDVPTRHLVPTLNAVTVRRRR
jgi:hypothetical protein